MLDGLEPGDGPVVTELDRLGRNAMGMGATVARLAGLGVQVHRLALGGVDLAGSTGKPTMNVVGPVAKAKRDLLVERTQAGWSIECGRGSGARWPAAQGRPTPARKGELP